MPGGLLNLVGAGQQNIILNGNPTKTFWKTSYCKYTNFGLQKFRLEYEGQKTINLTNPSQFTFKFKRYADLILDTYLAINLPHIWSPLYPIENPSNNKSYYIPYEFRWIKHLGTQMIQSIEVNVGGQTLQKYSGDYLTAMIERDFTTTKKELINRMTGNIAELNDPANAFNRQGRYPNATPNTSTLHSEPSIRGRTLYIPLNTWFNLNTKQAFPLVSLQYNELTITVTLRPVNELFQIRDVKDYENNFRFKAPNFNTKNELLSIFLQSPPKYNSPGGKLVTEDSFKQYYSKHNISEWNADIHMIATYGFLSDNERRIFAEKSQQYLISDIQETTFESLSVNKRLELNSIGLIGSWMWFARRDDAYLRNEWTNYTNWEYDGVMPSPIFIPPKQDPSYNLSSYEPKYSVNEPFIPPSIQFLSKQLKPNETMKNIRPIFKEQGGEYVDSADGYIGYIPPPIENLIINQKDITNMQPLWPEQGARSNCINAPTPPPTSAPTPCPTIPCKPTPAPIPKPTPKPTPKPIPGTPTPSPICNIGCAHLKAPQPIKTKNAYFYNDLCFNNLAFDISYYIKTYVQKKEAISGNKTFYYLPILDISNIPLKLSGTYDVWKSDTSQIYLFYWDPSSNNKYKYSIWFNNDTPAYYDVSLDNGKGCSITQHISQLPNTDVSFHINRNFIKTTLNASGGFGQALCLYYGNYKEITNILYYTNNNMKNNIQNIYNYNPTIKFGDVNCDTNYSSNPKDYRLFRIWKNEVTNTIIFYRASNNYNNKKDINYKYELVFARNFTVEQSLDNKNKNVDYYIDFICVQPTLNTNIFTLTLDTLINQFKDLTNKWYWTANSSPLTYKISFNSPLFTLSGGDNSDYRKKNNKSNISFKFVKSTPLKYSRLPLQFTKWIDCSNSIINTIYCEGIRALNNSFIEDCSFNSKNECGKFNDFPLLQHINSEFITAYIKNSSKSFEETYNFEMKYTPNQISYNMINNSNIYLKFVDINTFNISKNKTILSNSGETNINYFELRQYLDRFNTISSELNTNKYTDCSLLVLYDITSLQNAEDNLDNLPEKYPNNSSALKNYTNITQPNFNNVNTAKYNNSIPNFNTANDVSNIIENRYAFAWALVNTRQKDKILNQDVDVSLSLHFINLYGTWSSESIIFNTIANPNVKEALINWYTNGPYNYQYKLDMCNNNTYKIWWPGNLVNATYNCNSLYNSYYSNIKIRQTIDNFFEKNSDSGLDINNIWTMTPFMKGENSYVINEISGQLSNMDPLYLTHTNNTFLICQMYTQKLYPLVVYAKGEYLEDIMYANHSSFNINTLFNTNESYKWFKSGPDNSYTPFSYKDNVGSVISWITGTTLSGEMNSLFKYQKYDIFNEIITMDNNINNITLLGLLDSSCININNLNKEECSSILKTLNNIPVMGKTTYFQYYKRYSSRASMSIKRLNKFMKYINTDILHISGDCNTNNCIYNDNSINQHNLLYYFDISESSSIPSTVPIEPSYNYFETAQWFKLNCGTFSGLNNYVTTNDISLWYATKEYNTWIFITPLGDKLPTTSPSSSKSFIESTSIIIPDNYNFNINSKTQENNTSAEYYYNNFDDIFNNNSLYETIDLSPKFLSKTITSNISNKFVENEFVENEFVENEYIPLNNNYTNNSKNSEIKSKLTSKISPFVNFWGAANCPFSFSSTGVYTVENEKTILSNAAIVIDGKYRENLMDEGIYNYIEKYTRTAGAAKDGLYCYNFKLDTNPMLIQPTGAMNTNKFSKIELEVTTITPPLNNIKNYQTLCADDGTPIGTNLQNNNTFKYNYDIVFMEERYNIIEFVGGNVGVVFSN